MVDFFPSPLNAPISVLIWEASGLFVSPTFSSNGKTEFLKNCISGSGQLLKGQGKVVSSVLSPVGCRRYDFWGSEAFFLRSSPSSRRFPPVLHHPIQMQADVPRRFLNDPFSDRQMFETLPLYPHIVQFYQSLRCRPFRGPDERRRSNWRSRRH